MLLAERVAPLAQVGVGVLVPAWWTHRRRLGIRAKTSTKSLAAITTSGLGFAEVVQFTWEAALGDQRLTKADLATLQRAAAAKQSLVRVRGEWVEVRPENLAALLADNGTTATATVGDLLRTGLGLPAINATHGTSVVGVAASGGSRSSSMAPCTITTTRSRHPRGSSERCVRISERGVGWLRFLGRLGLGACLADDMGLGKTAQLLATVLADPVDAPTLVVCPTSVLGNWEREVARFAPHLRVLVHHGASRVRNDADALVRTM